MAELGSRSYRPRSFLFYSFAYFGGYVRVDGEIRPQPTKPTNKTLGDGSISDLA